MTRTIPSSGTVSSPGVALVVTLMMMSVLVMMVVGLAGVMRNEQAAARNITYQVLAEQVAEVGARQGMTAVLTSTPAGGQITATGPGWILAGNTTRYLFSPAASAQEIKNIERIGTNSLILGLPTGTRGGIYVGWSNLVLPGQPADRPIARYAWWVDDEGTKLNLNAVGSNNTEGFLPLLTNFPFSADWVFVTNWQTGQTNQTNANQAQALRSRLQWLPTPEVLKSSNFLNFTNAQVSDGTNNVLTGEQYHQIKGHVTTWSSNVDLTPWGAPKVNLADPAVTAAQIKAMLTTNVWTNVSGANRTLARKYGGGALTAGAAGNAGDIVVNQIVENFRTAAGNAVTVSNNTQNAGDLDPSRHRNGIPAAPVGLTQSLFLNEVAVSVSSRDLNANPPQILVTFYFQIEVFNPWPVASSGGDTLEMQPRKMRFHIGYNRIPADVVPTVVPNYGTTWPDSAGANNGLTGSSGCWVGPMIEDAFPWPSGVLLTASVPSVPARSWQTVSLQQTFTCIFPSGLTPAPNAMQVDQAYVAIDKIILKDSAGNPVDWVTLDDFAQTANYGATNTSRYVSATTNDYGQLNFSPSYPFAGPGYVTRPIDAVSTPAPPAVFSAANALGLAKNDPRVRFPMSVWGTTNGGFKPNGFSSSLLAWKRAVGGGAPGLTLGAHNAGVFDATSTNATGISYLNPDPAPGVITVLDHPHFAPGYAVMPPPAGGGFRSVAQLGSIHTGIPWRTLRLQPTPAAELVQGPPDWILLDAFTATDPTVARPRVNVNGLITSLQAANSANPGVPQINNNQSQTRPSPLLGVMGALRTNLTFTNTNAAISNGVITSMSTNTNAIFSTNRFLQIAASLSNVLSAPNQAGSSWAAGSGWSARRAAQSSNYPPNGFALLGEVLETSQLAHDGGTVGEDIAEGRLRGFLDLLTTRSDTFSVWSIGQGLVVVTNNAGTPIRTNVMGEVRKQTVFQRIPQFNAGAVTGFQLQVLYTRNHVVE